MSRSRPTAISVITLGCSKNTYDSEILMRQIEGNGLVLAEPSAAEVLIVNTCGFIDAAKEESINTILEATAMKDAGKVKKVYVAGCLSQRYAGELAEQIPEVDRFFGVTDFSRILEELGGSLKRELLGERHLSTPTHFAWMKISEGCDHPCSFCAIPIMRGGHVSRERADILSEARGLALRGVKELILIGQDTTNYGLDLDGRRTLSYLLSDLAEIDGIEWIRLMYTYPSQFPVDILPVMAASPKICKYIDMPIQHSEDAVLKSMRRGITRRGTLEVIDRIRESLPEAALRTTLITGYPTETEVDFENLCRFIEEVRFDRLGVFTYSVEDGTTAAILGDPLPASVKEERRARIMEIQSGISLERNSALVGREMRVLFDRVEGAHLVGRTEYDAPEVDNEVLLPLSDSMGPNHVGQFHTVTITDVTDFDLMAKI